LGLSIEEAAGKAGVGAKTWGRYESGASIRQDKERGVCRALRWTSFAVICSSEDGSKSENPFVVDNRHQAWSQGLADLYGTLCAATFAVGSDIVLDNLKQDLTELARSARGTHLGELPCSWFGDSLPRQFLHRYDYEFTYKLRSAVKLLRRRFRFGHLEAHTVLEEIALYLIFGEAESLADIGPEFSGAENQWLDWLGEMLSDLDVEYYLFSSAEVVAPGFTYHFDRWDEEQFWCYSQNVVDPVADSSQLSHKTED